MKFRFTLSNAVAGGSLVINEPDGWKTTRIKLERHPEFHSLVELIDTSFFYYNENDFIDGGREFLYGIEQAQGINATVTLQIDLSEDSYTWDLLFLGNLDLSTIKDVSKGDKFYKFSCNIIPTDLWARFLNRKSTAVDLMATTNIDGDPLSPPSSLLLQLPCQVTNKTYQAENYAITDSSYNPYQIDFTATENFAVIDLPNVLLQEFEVKYNYPGIAGAEVFPLFTVKEAGVYSFDIHVSLSNNPNRSGSAVPNPLYVFLQINNGASTSLTKTLVGTIGVDQYAHFDYTGNRYLHIGDDIKIFIQYPTGSDASLFVLAEGFGSSVESSIIITGATIAGDTVTDSLMIYDVAKSIVKNITGFDIYSEYLGRIANGYAADGCGSLFANMLGLHIRGYEFIDKKFFQSFDQFWSGADPILNMGVGILTIGATEYLNIEEKGNFYDDNPILTFSDVEGIERSYDKTQIYKEVEIGYGTWSNESASGIDDPQTVHTYSTIFKIIGNAIKISSTWVAASLSIEQIRRNRKKTDDTRLDNNTIIIALENKKTLGTPETLSVEVDQPFQNITNLFNPPTRYNIRLSVYKNLRRWLPFLSGSLDKYLTSPFRFNTGQGNYKMAVGTSYDTCDEGTWAEDQNVPPSQVAYHTAGQYLFSADLSWTDYKLLRANRKRAILVSPTDADHKVVHINTLAYDIPSAKATITGWLKTEFGPLDPFTFTADLTVTAPAVGSYDYTMAFLQQDTVSRSINLSRTTVGTSSGGPIDCDIISIPFPLTMTVQKTSGFSVTLVAIKYYKNAVLQHQTNFFGGNPISDLYVYPSVMPGDVINVSITE